MKTFLTLTLFAAVVAFSAPAVEAGDDAPQAERQVRKIIIECEGEDCDAGAHVMALGDASVWIPKHGCEGEECEFEITREVDFDCEGEECEHQVYVFKGAPKPGRDYHFSYGLGPRPFLGVQFLPLTDELADHFGEEAELAQARFAEQVIPALRAAVE